MNAVVHLHIIPTQGLTHERNGYGWLWEERRNQLEEGLKFKLHNLYASACIRPRSRQIWPPPPNFMC